MSATTVGFLESLYSGSFDPEVIKPVPEPVDEEKVEKFVEQYHEIVSKYKPLDLEAKGSVPKTLLKEFGELGLFGLTIPTEYGGLGFTLTEYLKVVAEMARSDMALVLVPLAHLSIGLKGIVLHGTDEQKQKYLTKAATGKMIFAYALTEPLIGSDAQNIKTEARASDDGSYYVLNGTKTYITNGNYAGGFTVFAQLDSENNPGHMGAFIVEKSWDGVEVGPDMPKMGLKVSSTTPVRFKNVRIPAENLLGRLGDGFKIAMTVLNYGRLGLGAAGAGMMWQSLRDMDKRSRSRKQFGMAIRDFQLIQEKLARAKAHALAGESMTYLTARMLEHNPLMNVAIESSHCKLYGTDRSWDTLYDALQTAGGSGFLQTQPYEKRMRDARVTTIFEGTTEIHSIYPPLTVFRTASKEFKAMSGTFARWRKLRQLTRGTHVNQVQVSHEILHRAIQVARMSEKLFRKHLRFGLTKLGKKVTTEEFFLRRMTNLSLSTYWLVATAVMLHDRYGGDLPEDLVPVVEYLIAEAVEVQEQSTVRTSTPKERATRDLVKAL